MAARLTQLVVVSLLAGAAPLRTAENETSVKLTDRAAPVIKITTRTETSLTRAEAISALDTIAALNRLQFVLVGDDEVKVLPAALILRETNPVQ